MKQNPNNFFRAAALLAAFFAAGTANANAEESAPAPEISAAVAGTDIVQPELPPPERFATAHSAFFSFSAESSDDANRAKELAQELEDYMLRTPRLWKNFLPSAGARVRAELFSAPGIFRLRKPDAEHTELFLSANFSDEAEKNRMRECLAEALLSQMFLPAHPASGVPAWIVSAVAAESRLGSVRGRHFFLRKKSSSATPVSPAALIAAPKEKFADDEIFRINALWFLRAQKNVSVFFDTKKTPEEKLAAAFPKIFPDGKYDAGTAEKFWAARFFGMIEEEPAGMDLPRESQRVFDDALLFLVNENGSETRVLAGDLVAFRIQPEIREIAAARLAEFAARFKKVNPVWHNAFTEYGLFLEMFGDPDVPAETLSSQWEKALLAREEAIAMQREIRDALLRP